MPHTQVKATSQSLADPESFWSHHATQLHWHRKPSRALTRHTKTLPSGVSHEHWSWFADSEISTSYNCVDRHVLAGHGDNVAIIWESPVTGSTETYTYAQLLEEIDVLAGVLREEGVQKGDVVIIYSMYIHSPINPPRWRQVSTYPYPIQIHIPVSIPSPPSPPPQLPHNMNHMTSNH